MTPHGCITSSPVDVTQAGGDKWFTLWRLLNPHLAPINLKEPYDIAYDPYRSYSP